MKESLWNLFFRPEKMPFSEIAKEKGSDFLDELKIKSIRARHIFDSRGNPTISCTVHLENGKSGTAAVPSGASTGKYEALELRDKEKAYGGNGVFRAIWNINNDLCNLLREKNALDQRAVDHAMIEFDGSENKSKMGANAILAVSLANARACANACDLPLYRYLGGEDATLLPLPFMNVLNGGRHAANRLDIQEFMIVPTGAHTFAEAMKIGSEVYHALGRILKEDDYSTGLGDEGGFAPEMENEEQALTYILRAVEFAGYKPGEDVVLALDAAASEWYKDGVYRMPKSGRHFSSTALCEFFEKLVRDYPIISLEDPLGEEDFEGFSMLTERLHKKVQIVGDDLFVTNEQRLKKGISQGACNAVLIKPNQVGTLSETEKTIHTAYKCDYNAMMSHRSGETEDTTIADLAVAYSTGQIKSGAPARGERTAKYNRLLEIEDDLAGAGRLASLNEIF